MDVVLEFSDHYILDHIWAKLVPLQQSTESPAWLTRFAESLPTFFQPPPPTVFREELVSAWPRSYIIRQMFSVTWITLLGTVILYFLFGCLSYYFVFDHRMMKHPRFLKNQIKMEIWTSLWSFPGMTMLMMPWFEGEVRGHSRLYHNMDEYGWTYFILSPLLFLLFTDYCIYWIHRWLHLPFLYKHVHKPHHKWIIPTPFASHAFHPLDGYAQSLPYHLFVFLFPIQRHLYLALFGMVNLWSVFIHDSDMVISSNSQVEKFINTPAHHTLHHLYFTCNYGQYFTWADHAGGSYRPPEPALHPLLEVVSAEQAGPHQANGDTAAPRKVVWQSKDE
ncbi:hypothetical protein BS47DRAFT_1292957 [Hydnum rufescens UP504]|uniref:Fatty acid hydroxylase domain-containing protein n=1 Tax=Hydnum rufescens UP504 TaxID=1448309 RepID=A0A9P6B1V9_9AGAM|nr:hypothetical protein BS47DRAFT_1292957 [Hydnum rufescens UP504]